MTLHVNYRSISLVTINTGPFNTTWMASVFIVVSETDLSFPPLSCLVSSSRLYQNHNEIPTHTHTHTHEWLKLKRLTIVSADQDLE